MTPSIFAIPSKIKGVVINDEENSAMSPVRVTFLPDNAVTEAEPGEPLLTVAARAGVDIPTGCLMGSCHACEVSLPNGDTLCACISAVPAGQPELVLDLTFDPTW